MAIISMAFKFIGGPFLMAAASLAIGLRGTQLRVAIVQVHIFLFEQCQMETLLLSSVFEKLTLINNSYYNMVPIRITCHEM